MPSKRTEAAGIPGRCRLHFDAYLTFDKISEIDVTAAEMSYSVGQNFGVLILRP